MATKKPTKREAARMAFIRGNGMGGHRAEYTLMVPPGHAATRPFRHLNYTVFNRYAPAQAIANAIRAHITGSR